MLQAQLAPMGRYSGTNHEQFALDRLQLASYDADCSGQDVTRLIVLATCVRLMARPALLGSYEIGSVVSYLCIVTMTKN